MSALEIQHRDPGSHARAGVLRLAHGDVRTPAFVPLATKGTIKTLTPADVEALGYDMVLGNTFHLFLDPGTSSSRSSAGCTIHALGAADHHRLGRLPGVLDGPWDGRRRGEGPRADGRRAPGPDPEHRGAGRALPVVSGRERAVHGPGDLDGGAGRAALGHRARLRRVHAVPRVARLHRGVDRAHPPLAAALPGVARRARARGTAPVRDRPGRSPRGPAPGVRAGRRGGRLRRDRDRRLARPGQGADLRGRGLGGRRARRGPAAPPPRDRRRRRPRPRRRAGDGHLRLRDADPPRPPRRRRRPGPRCAAGAPT